MFNHQPDFVGRILRAVGEFRFGFPDSEPSASTGQSIAEAGIQLDTRRLISPLSAIRESFAKERLLPLSTVWSADNVELVLLDLPSIDSANDREDLVLAVEGFSTTHDGAR